LNSSGREKVWGIKKEMGKRRNKLTSTGKGAYIKRKPPRRKTSIGTRRSREKEPPYPRLDGRNRRRPNLWKKHQVVDEGKRADPKFRTEKARDWKNHLLRGRTGKGGRPMNMDRWARPRTGPRRFWRKKRKGKKRKERPNKVRANCNPPGGCPEQVHKRSLVEGPGRTEEFSDQKQEARSVGQGKEKIKDSQKRPNLRGRGWGKLTSRPAGKR